MRLYAQDLAVALGLIVLVLVSTGLLAAFA
jgi:hypothetical protein